MGSGTYRKGLDIMIKRWEEFKSMSDIWIRRV